MERQSAPTSHLSAFGLDVEADWSLSGSSPGPPPSGRSSRRVAIRTASMAAFDAAWQQPAEPVFAFAADGVETSFTVERAAEHHRLWLHGFGRYLIANDGTTIRYERDAVPSAARERFVFAQALPVAAVLSGLEVLHASAVCGPSAAAAFVGPSGSGKTTTAVELVLRGARLMTDDVLAIEAEPSGPVAHPGPPFVALREDDRLTKDVVIKLGESAGSSGKLHLTPRVGEEPLQLRVIYHLERAPQPAIEELREGHGPRVLANAFVPYLRSPDRLARHLEMAQLLSSSAAHFRLCTPVGGPDETTLAELEAHLREQGV